MNKISALRRTVAISIFLTALALQGCGVRSISDSGYQAESQGRFRPASKALYKGELTEFEVLGIASQTPASQEEINRSLEDRQRLTLPKGSPIMLVQSGAIMPDDQMVRALESHHRIVAFSGIPTEPSNGNIAPALRLAAARGGCEKIMVYWGILETAQKDMSTKTVSWVPIIGGMIPDESQEMRIRLKVAIIDVKSGQWKTISPKPIQDTSASARYTRASSDQRQVETLKSQAYAELANDIANNHAE